MLLSAHKNMQVCGQAQNGKDVIAKPERLAPGAIIMDVSMSIMNGFDATCGIGALVATGSNLAAHPVRRVGNRSRGKAYRRKRVRNKVLDLDRVAFRSETIVTARA